MSTQILDDVELVTKQEVEAMLDEVVTPESDIDNKIEAASTVLEQSIAAAKAELRSETELVASNLEQETAQRTAADTTLDSKISDEAELRETGDDTLRSRIEREEGVREAADHALSETISAETTAREEADTALRAEFKSLLTAKKSTQFEDTVFCVRFENIPLAQATIEVTDSTLAVGDVLATVSADYLPESPVTFNFVAELTNQTTSATEYYYISVRLDAAGNATIINKTQLDGEYVGNVNSATFLYITKE